MNQKVIDLAELDTIAACDKGTEIELLHPVNKTPLGIYIGVLGKDSKVFREHMRETINADLRQAALARRRGKNEEVPTIEKGEAKGIELLVVCTTSWRTGEEKTITLRGEKLPFTVANAKRLYEEMPWIRNQVDEGIGDLENFLKG